MTDQRTLKEFIAKYKLSMRSEVAYSNPNMADSDRMNHYAVTITLGERYSGQGEMKLVFSQGLGIKHKPTPEDVLDCLASDSAGYENTRSFEDWAGEYGYDTDSRTAEKTYHAVAEQAKKLEHFLNHASPDAYNELLWETEKL